MTIRVVVADDQGMVRAGFAALLEAHEGITVVGQAENGAQAVEMVRRERPDVVLMDVRMPVLNGIDATRQIMGEQGISAPRILVLTTFDIDEYVYDALEAGASGFLLKDALPHDLVNAVRVVANGEALLAPAVTKRLIEQFVSRPPANPRHLQRLVDLTDREREVLTLIGRGLSNAEIAGTLFIAEQTAKSHVSRVLTKLGVRDRVQAVVFAYDAGIVTPRGPAE